MKIRKFRVALATLAFVVGCSDNPAQQPSRDGGKVDARSVDAATRDATQGDGRVADAARSDATTGDGGTVLQVPAAVGLAVVNSDFQSTSVAVLDGQGKVLNADCINSGSKAPKLTIALSGDVALPSQPQPGNKLVLIDRANATLTWVDPKTCAVERQVPVGTGFAANPQDVAAVGGKLYVSRYEQNAKPTSTPSDFDEGSDVLVIDDASGKPTGRIDLIPHATKALATVWPRPSRMVLVGGKLYLVLTNIGPNFAADEIGPGRVLEIDPAQDKVTRTFDLPNLSNCGGLSVGAAAGGLAVVCNGNFKKKSQLDESGVAWIALTAGATPKVVGAKAAGRPLAFALVATFGPQATYVATPGEFAGTPPDALYAVDFAAQTAVKFAEGSGGFVFESATVDAPNKRLYVPHGDAKTPRVKTFDLTVAGAPKASAEIEASKSGLPSRSISWY